jgi:hypothetical protein
MGKTPHPTPHTPTPNPQPPTPNPQPPPKNFFSRPYLLSLDIGAKKIVIFMDFCYSCLPIFYRFYFFGMVIGAG